MSGAPTSTAPRERPILFSAPMIQAILAGRKSQTRRIVKWQGPRGFPHFFDRAFLDNPAGIKRLCVPYHHSDEPDAGDDNPAHRHYPPHGEPGDRLWVRESWCVTGHNLVTYRADGTTRQVEHPDCERLWTTQGSSRWRSPRHMPRWASRITLEIVDVRVERLQDISEADARAEGLLSWTKDGRLYKWAPFMVHAPSGERDPIWPWAEMPKSAREAYARLWESIHGPNAWDENPWVFVIEFRRLD